MIKIAAIFGLALATSTLAVAQWSYHADADKMRATVTKRAHLLSTNGRAALLAFDDPNLQPDERRYIGLRVGGREMFGCQGSSNCEIHMKFDNGEVNGYLGSDESDDYRTLWFSTYVSKLVFERLKTAKIAIIEAPLFRGGRTQFTFRFAPLKWPAQPE